MRRVLGIYSKQYKRLKDVPDVEVMIMPDEAVGFGRALFFMPGGGLIT
ncbi:MetQ/NlpA family ABC transporter substrate-binding protein [Bacillus siamensis]|nr:MULTISPECIES: MetQ/NlpA family ABC transporter substrate-binding protein [Bacillus]UUA82995.1 MetQ/NlpA family ABC transporter substrate-binding protein [Bacillus siamensis]